MSTKERTLSERRLVRASEHVNNFWFPVNAELHRKIKELIHNDQGLETKELVKEVQGDFSLFLYCIRETASLLKEEGVEIPITRHPIELLEWAGIQRLKKILDVETTTISPHTLDKAHLFQKMGIEEAIISASASQVLSEKSGVSSEIAYSTALLRQLGYALIAWNYAGIYHQALLQVRPSDPLDSVLTRLLGFSPSTLAMVVIQNWGLPSYIQRSVDNQTPAKQISTPENNAIIQSLTKICKIAEAFSRANAPELHPTAFHDWEMARTEIAKVLGEDGLQKIRDKITETAQAYTELLPQVFKGSFVLDPAVKLKEAQQSSFEANPYVYECSAELKEALLELYRRMGKEAVTPLVRTIVKEVIPKSGFVSGCVYTVDPGSAWLIPQLGFGKTNIATLKPRPVKSDTQETDCVVKAFNTTDIVVGSVADADTPQAFLARTLGYSQRFGVLYLETPQMLNEILTNETRNEFNAIALALTDCLTLVT